jgi:vacuolar-type H+-ATPase subunit F/Vma7
MTLCAFIGDELTGAGFRLAGARVHSPPAAEIPQLFRRLCQECRLLILTAEAAAGVPEELLRQTTAAGSPLLLVVPDARERRRPVDLAAMVRGTLGMGE